MDDLPYKSEYSKSGRASCRGCKSVIAKDSLRLAVMVQSPVFDGKAANWYHYSCFFSKQRPQTVDDIQNFELLKWKDQEKIREKIENAPAAIVPTKGKKRTKEAQAALKDYRIEYAKSSRAVCRGCEVKIMKEEVRIAKKDFTTEVGMKYGGQDMWYHVSCFAQLRSELGYYADGSNLPNFNTLKSADKEDVQKHLPAIKQEEENGETSAKKVKKEEEPKSDLEIKLKEQTDRMCSYRDKLKKLSKAQLQKLLEANGQDIPPGPERMRDRLADLMAFGTLLPCPECKGQLVLDRGGYKCRGNVTEWSKCTNIVKEPKRTNFNIPNDFKEKFPFLNKYNVMPSVRVFKEHNPTTVVKKDEKDEVDAKPKVSRTRPPLYEMNFVILGNLSIDKNEAKKKLGLLGAKVTTKIDDKVMAVISTPQEVEKMSARMEVAQQFDLHVVPEDFIDAVVAGFSQEKVIELIIEKNICQWGSDPTKRLPQEVVKSTKSKSLYTSKVPSKVTMKLKGGTAVDPDSGLEDVAHVYVSGDDKYTVVLGRADVQTGANSYYKLQLLQSDKRGDKFWLWRSWGRIGTTIGGTKLDRMETLIDAKRQFNYYYLDKSGNKWENRHNFKKVAGRFYPIDVDYSDDTTDSLAVSSDTPSKLPEPVQNLMKLIFNISDMKKLMLEFELDMEKMPLGKLSKSQISKAYGVLSEVQNLLNQSDVSESRFVAASNQFYTYIPHSADVGEQLPILKTQEQIKQKIDMIENLMELEIAYNLMKASSSSSVDSHYEQLKTEIDVLDRDSEEFSLIREYVKNTHAKTHDSYDLIVTEVFTIKRKGEDKRFRPFRKLHNRQLLWHGSRITNYAGILSQGLRIAPPEAPVTGYMFGKGIYFADMVSKSANYCCTTRTSNTGLLLLCDVALGNMVEHSNATYIEKLPSGKHSCKGVGMTYPDPSASKEIHDKITVPLGKPVKKKNFESSLLYNEFIVYDAAQVNIRYLVKTEFKYKGFK